MLEVEQVHFFQCLSNSGDQRPLIRAPEPMLGSAQLRRNVIVGTQLRSFIFVTRMLHQYAEPRRPLAEWRRACVCSCCKTLTRSSDEEMSSVSGCVSPKTRPAISRAFVYS